MQDVRAGVNVVYRLDDGLGYAVVGAVSPRVLEQIARTSYPDFID
jgi:hypothetical protein